MQKMKFTTLPRGINACWCWFTFSSFFPTCPRNIYPSVMLWMWVCGSISLQKYSPDSSFHLPVFSKESTAFTFSSQPPQSCCEKLVCIQSYFWSFTKDSLSIIFMYFHCHSFVFASHLLHKIQKKKKKKKNVHKRISHFVRVISLSFHQSSTRLASVFSCSLSWSHPEYDISGRIEAAN